MSINTSPFKDVPSDTLRLNLGTNSFGWTTQRDDAFAILDAFMDEGGWMIDTADNYSMWVPGNSGGEAEEVLGEWLAKRRNRSDVFLATKVSRHPPFLGLGRASIRGGIDASLKRLGTDHVDLYYAHYDDPNTPIEESAAAFHELQLDGKVRYIGLSNYSAARIGEWMRVCEANNFPRPVAVQTHYNLVYRRSYETKIYPACESHDVVAMPYFALASGFLAGKYRSSESLHSSLRGERFAAVYMSDAALGVVDALITMARERNLDIASLALAWLRDKPGVFAPIAGARTGSQLGALVCGARISLESSDMETLDSLSLGLPCDD